MNKLDNLLPVVRLAIVQPDNTSTAEFGRGIANLCRGVRETGSLNAAAKQMGMAYSKAWRIIKETESGLDLQILNRDGAHGSTLTAEGEALLDAYDQLNNTLQEDAEAIFLQQLNQKS